MSLIRSVIFAALQTVLTILFSVVALLSFPFPAHARYRLITGYNHTVIWLAWRCSASIRPMKKETCCSC